eukprot:gene13980-16525_t
MAEAQEDPMPTSEDNVITQEPEQAACENEDTSETPQVGDKRKEPESDQGAVEGEVDPENADAADQAAAKKPKKTGPYTLGPKTFTNITDTYNYFSVLRRECTLNQPLNEYEYRVCVELLKQGHHDVGSKIGCGLKAIKVVEHESWESRCFMIVRTDGSTDDFSTRKCIEALFPDDVDELRTLEYMNK